MDGAGGTNKNKVPWSLAWKSTYYKCNIICWICWPNNWWCNISVYLSKDDLMILPEDVASALK